MTLRLREMRRLVMMINHPIDWDYKLIKYLGNKKEFAIQWAMRYGGTFDNAWKIYPVCLHEAQSKHLWPLTQ